MQKGRVLFTVLLLFGAVTLLFASGAKEEGTAAVDAGPVTVTAWMGSWWQNDIPRVVEAFESTHPNRKLVIEPVPINGYLEKAITAVLGGSPPDVLSLDANFIAEMAGRNLLLPWDEQVKKLDLSDFNQGMVQASTVNGKMYAIPYRGASGVYFYNKTMFDQAGVPYPKEGWTYADMLDIAKKITVPGEKYGVGIAAALSDPANVFTSFAPVLWAYGGEFLNDDNTKARINEPAGVKAITYWTELYTKYKVVPEGSINFAITKDVVPLFMNDKVALFPGTSAQFSMLEENPNVKWGVVVGPDGWNRGGGWAYAIPTGAKNVDAAREYVLWFAEPKQQSELMIRQPARLSATSAPPWNEPKYEPIFRASKWAKLLPITPAWGEMSNIIITELQMIMQKTKTPQQGADDMARQMNEALAKK